MSCDDLIPDKFSHSAKFERFFQSAKFKLFVDEDLRKAAIKEVENLIAGPSGPVKPHQLYSIKTAIQSLQWNGLIALAEAQKNKNTKKDNAAFWSKVHSIIAKNDSSFLVKKAEELLKSEGFWRDQESVSDKAEKGKVKNENKADRELLINKIIGVYFEHFVCHYAYLTTK